MLSPDTRSSGILLSPKWLASDLSAAGAEVLDSGFLPTAALGRWVVAQQAVAGVVMSTSHSPPEDNGIKLFDQRAASGRKSRSQNGSRSGATCPRRKLTLGKRVSTIEAA